MDVTKYVRQAYITLLTGLGYSVWDRFLPDILGTGLYIILADQQDSLQNNKCSNGHLHNILLDITHRTDDNSSGVVCDNVAEAITPIILADGLVLASGLTLIQGSTRKLSDSTSDGLGDVYRIYRRLIRFEHIIKEN